MESKVCLGSPSWGILLTWPSHLNQDLSIRRSNGSMLRDFRISELRTLLNSVTSSTLGKNLISDPCICDHTLSVITQDSYTPRARVAWLGGEEHKLLLGVTKTFFPQIREWRPESKSQNSMNSEVKTKKKGLYCKICEKTVLDHEFCVDDQYFGGLRHQLHSNGNRACFFLRGTTLAWEAQFSFGGARAVIWGHGRGMPPPWRRAWIHYQRWEWGQKLFWKLRASFFRQFSFHDNRIVQSSQYCARLANSRIQFFALPSVTRECNPTYWNFSTCFIHLQQALSRVFYGEVPQF